MSQEYHLEYQPSCGGVSFYIGICNCSHVRVKAYVDWGIGRLKVWLDGEEIINVDAPYHGWVDTQVDVVPNKVFSTIVIGLSDPNALAISQIEAWYTCEEIESDYGNIDGINYW